MAVSIIDRVRIQMDMIKDGDVANEAAYAQVDKIDGPTALKYATAAWEMFPQFRVAVDPENPTNAELARQYNKVQRWWNRNLLVGVRAKAAEIAAREAETAAVEAEIADELGE